MAPSAVGRAARPRIPTLDAARALGTLAMVFGHTLDALLAPAVRETPLAVAYWKARGLTAPLFLMVSGWAVTVAISRGRASGPAILRGRLPRVVLLLAIGYALRWPGWGLARLVAGDPAVWSHFLAFDALHTIAVSLLATAAVLALPWTRREKGLTLAALLLLAWTLALRAPAPLAPAAAAVPRAPALIALWQAGGGTSPFALFPWATYFFAGAILALASREGAPRAGALAAVGGALVLATCWTGVGTMPPANPLLIAFRIGAILLILAVLTRIPAAAAARVAPLGRASLGVYAIHVPIVYGWSTFDGLARRIGPTCGVGAALAVAACVLLGSLGLHRAIQAARRVGAASVARARAAILGGGAAEVD